jgi:hypothetical protein
VAKRDQARRKLLRKDTRPIKVVGREKREFWERIETKPVRIGVARNHGKKWTKDQIKRIITANPENDTYQTLAAELGRSDGSVRLIRTWAGHMLKGEYEQDWRRWVESTDPRVRANKHDRILIYEVLEELGYFDLSISQQFKLARPLPQPRAGWRGDRTGEALRRRRSRVAQVQARLIRANEEATHDDRSRGPDGQDS